MPRWPTTNSSGRVFGAVGGVVVVGMFLACVLTLPWTMGRYEATDLSRILLPPSWAPHAEDEEVRRLVERNLVRAGDKSRSYDRVGETKRGDAFVEVRFICSLAPSGQYDEHVATGRPQTGRGGCRQSANVAVAHTLYDVHRGRS